ncbi:hypothetical protein GKZ28_07965 [Clostridium chromiireducens]|uniref:Uncharacterized protein n=1 Tax=Clostridium chromiireducens TaxID=225345 RepID=A0A964RKW7_9CLOT|nr:hypothetical protein [Clostridium chromiireducens]MVX63629.1 hypothetical protein [Clostridium chromiireducens]
MCFITALDEIQLTGGKEKSVAAVGTIEHLVEYGAPELDVLTQVYICYYD